MERVLANPVMPPTMQKVPTTYAGYADCNEGEMVVVGMVYIEAHHLW